MSVRAELMRLIIELPDEALPEAERLLDGLRALSARDAENHLAGVRYDRLGPDALGTALAMATDLGPDVSSEDPHGFAGRDKRWFEAEE